MTEPSNSKSASISAYIASQPGPTGPRGGITYPDPTSVEWRPNLRPGLVDHDMAARLSALAEHLEPGLARYVRELVRADSSARNYLEVERYAQRAEALTVEMRKVIEGHARSLERARERERELLREIDALKDCV